MIITSSTLLFNPLPPFQQSPPYPALILSSLREKKKKEKQEIIKLLTHFRQETHYLLRKADFSCLTVHMKTQTFPLFSGCSMTQTLPCSSELSQLSTVVVNLAWTFKLSAEFLNTPVTEWTPDHFYHNLCGWDPGPSIVSKVSQLITVPSWGLLHANPSRSWRYPTSHISRVAR